MNSSSRCFPSDLMMPAVTVTVFSHKVLMIIIIENCQSKLRDSASQDSSPKQLQNGYLKSQIIFSSQIAHCFVKYFLGSNTQYFSNSDSSRMIYRVGGPNKLVNNCEHTEKVMSLGKAHVDPLCPCDLSLFYTSLIWFSFQLHDL